MQNLIPKPVEAHADGSVFSLSPVLSIYVESALGDEGYELTITHDAVSLSAFKPAGLLSGVQTILQLFPVADVKRYFDLPRHTNAALAAYPELNCDGVAHSRRKDALRLNFYHAPQVSWSK